jgi:peptidoglycan/LPS O-acetylase OafA/YrhL
MWYKLVEESGYCRQHWWTNLLYINNFHPADFHEQCMSWTWYLANDMQFFILGLVVLFVYVRSKPLGYSVLVGTIIASNIGGYLKLAKVGSAGQQNAWYDKPYMRISSIFVGMAVGMLLKDTKLKEWRLSSMKATLAMTVAIANFFASVYMSYSWNKDDRALTDPQFAAYMTFARMYFTFSVTAIVVLGVTKNGGIVYEFLSLGFWEPLGKLTFGAYLIHPIVIRGYFLSMNQNFDFNMWTFSIAFMGVLLISYSASAVLHILIELPFANLVALAFGGLVGGKKKKLPGGVGGVGRNDGNAA